MRRDEQLVAQEIEAYIRARALGMQVSLEPGSNPPDFVLIIGPETFPLEVTSTEVWRDPSFGQGQVRERTFENSHTKLLKELEEEAIKTGAIQGRYAIAFEAPLSAQEFPKRRTEFQSALLSILRSSREHPQGFQVDIELDGKPVASAYKLAEEGSRVFEVFEDGAWTEAPEFIALVRGMLLRAIDIKRRKLEGKAPPARSILAILNTYGLADRQALLQAAESLKSEMSHFHTVFLVDQRHVLPIHSVNAKWRGGDA
jgi:hypothetical protein